MGDELHLLTIVIPAYGESPYLERCISSIVDSQDPSVQIVVIDDASPTTFVQIVAEKYFPRISYLRNEKNLGIANNFNKALSSANSLFVQIVGQDDLIMDSMVKVIQSADNLSEKCFAIHPAVTSVNGLGNPSFGMYEVFKSIIKPDSGRAYSGENLRKRLLLGNWTYFPSIIWNKKLLPEAPFSHELNYCMDLELLLRMCATDSFFFLSDKKGFIYRRHRESVSMGAEPRKRFVEEMNVIRGHRRKTITERLFFGLGSLPFLNMCLSEIKLFRSHIRSSLREFMSIFT
jgi:glycosyltransferase involved in cell wall biosynthesis